MTDLDERILRAITGNSGGESHLEPGDRRGPDPDAESDHSLNSDEEELDDDPRPQREVPPPNTAATRALSDAALRQHLEIGGAKTGPKGVIADRKFHQRQERARHEIEQRRNWDVLDKKALSSGWAARQIAEEKSGSSGAGQLAAALETLRVQADDEEDDENSYMAEYRAKRLAQMARIASLPQFGTVTELESSDDYLSAVDDEAPYVTVIIHLYQPNMQQCRLVNTLLDRIAARYPSVKFCRILSHVADESFDQIALPALIAYRNGDTIATALRVLDDVESYKRDGRCDHEDLEAVLHSVGLLEDVADIGDRLGGLCVSG
ncbi:hypothetical protein PhCBS80983_g05364 [Powellomyces hirtus]|uniref:Phosducin domain-containing protein n=1 Tax=Powellomyces hirtus TaxID=109895 RepID=A0A507DWX9_9FUNG|nr:hypothetical protein PhCBS80983_g05364 [Powellomyces hirtus]